MIYRRFLAASALLSVVSVFSAKPAAASSGDARARASLEQFDLQQMKRTRAGDRRFRLGNSEGADRFRAQKGRPHWIYSPMEGGPKLELGALGGGGKGAPKLAHARIDWQF